MARFIYLDEAGISDEKSEPWLVVGGVLVHADTQLNKLYEGLEAIGRHTPDKYRREGLVLHPSHIYGGNGKFDERRYPEWTGERRMAVLEELAQLPKKANILITGAPIERAKFPAQIEVPLQAGRYLAGRGKKPASRTVHAHAVAYMACLLECDVWLRTNAKHENCMVIVEDNDEAKAAIKQVHRYHQNKSMPLRDEQRKHWPLRRVKEDPAFQEKRQDHPLILADFVAFVLKRHCMGDPKIEPFYSPLMERLAVLNLPEDNQLDD